ncbi:MAG: hypothetical protein HYS38_06155 [Acidobacteria bacterium]|nr:hypothetical protein [Acidobacteriota bacterium]
MPYHISARAYLERARAQLDLGTAEALFYAAFELRAGIQARMQQYLKAQKLIAKHKKEDWNLGKLKRSLDEAFEIGDRIAEVAFYDPGASEPLAVLYYTPVTSELRRNGESLGELLHAMQQFRNDDDAWWQTTREFLEAVYGNLRVACSGKLLAPLLRERDSDRVVMQAEALDESDRKTFQKIGPGFAVVHVQYLDKLPQAN